MFIQTIKPQDIFRTACFHTRPLVYLRALRIYGNNAQLTANSNAVEGNSIISNICGWCNKEIIESEFDYFAGYWTPNIWRAAHKECKIPYKNTETIECQKIDADCNDCKHFSRERSLGKGIYEGLCSKYGSKTRANTNFATGRCCFEHRRDTI